MSKVFIRIWLFCLIIIAICVTVQGVNDYHYSEDEALHIGIAGGKFIRQVIEYSFFEAHPPLGHIIRHEWMRISDSVWFVRTLSLLFGIAMIPLYYRIGKLLHGEMTGICSATLTAFSYGLIIQSYVARNYSMFLFFLSAAFLAYLIWRNNDERRNVFYYILFASLACLTHFSGIFAVLVIAAYETCERFVQKDKSKLALWIIANLLVTSIACTAYYLWKMHSTITAGNFLAHITIQKFIIMLLVNPINAAIYVLPDVVFLIITLVLLCLPVNRNDRTLSRFLGLTSLALLAGIALTANNLYYPAGTRHGIWIFPFIIPAAAWVIANTLSLLRKQFAFLTPQILSTFVLLGGLASSDMGQRFVRETSEYQMKKQQWEEMSEYLEKIGPRKLIVAGRDDAIMLKNLYPYLGNGAKSGKVMSTFVPYRNTQILINPYFRRISTFDILKRTIMEARAHERLDDIDKFIFMKTEWDIFGEPENPLPDIIADPTLSKKIVSFNASGAAPLEFVEVHKGGLISYLKQH